MMPFIRKPLLLAMSGALLATALAGCATVDINESLGRANADVASFSKGALTLAQSDSQRAALAGAADELLAKPLSQDDAVRLALVNSPSMQALLAQHWGDSVDAAQSGRINNPILTLERLRSPAEIELSRMLAFGLLDLLTLPQRQRVAASRVEQAQLQLAASVVESVTQVRQAWVSAVASAQSLQYAQQVNDSAEASAELARRMQAVGNFSKLQRARQQSFYADAVVLLANSAQATKASREALVRLLGLTDVQAARLQLPERLPALPDAPRAPEEVASAATTARLDLRMAQAALDTVAKAQGINLIGSFTDIELSVIRNTATERADGHKTQFRGAEVALKLPVFDWGDLRRDAMRAQVLVAANRLEATVRSAASHLRETYAAYRTAHDTAKHYRDEIVPLRKLIADENVLRYNGMLIGVFELLADSRDQIASVSASINAQQQFWLADAALQATIVGKPMTVAAMGASPSMGGGGDAQH
jgi:outer membrane protein TolC